MTQLPLTEPPRQISRDEMNLAEFPLSVLSTRVDSKVKTLEFRDTIRGKNGEVYNRDWIVTGADKFGLPTSSDDEVLLGLLKLTVSEGFRERKIFFTRYELLKILHWTTEGRSYGRLQAALDRLSGVRIKATNAFYDNESKAHVTRNFGIIDAYEISDGRDSKPSFFTWSDVLFKSFQVGFIKKFDLDFCLGLKSAVSKRLYRFLDKHFWYRAKIQLNLFTLAHEKIGISRNCKYASSIRQQVDPALEELIERGFVSHFEYTGKGGATEIAIYAARGKPRMGDKDKPAQLGPIEVDSQRSVSALDATDLRAEIEEALVARGIRSHQVGRLLEKKDTPTLERIRSIVEYYDHLLASGSNRVSKSPIGFLYRAVEKPENFSLPGENTRKVEQGTLGFAEQSYSKRAGASQLEAQRYKTKNDSAQLEAEYLVFRKKEIQMLREQSEASLVSKISIEVERSLQSVRGSLSPAGFSLAVSHGVEEKIATLFAVPSFDEWLLVKAGKGRRAGRQVN